MDESLAGLLDKVSRNSRLNKASYWEVRAGSRDSRILRFRNGSVRDSSLESGSAVSVRVLAGGSWGFSAAVLERGFDSFRIEGIVRSALKNAGVSAGSRIAKKTAGVEGESVVSGSFFTGMKVNPEDVDDSEVVELMRSARENALESFGKRRDDFPVQKSNPGGAGRISSVGISYAFSKRKVALVNSCGSGAFQELDYTYGSINITGKRGGRIEEQSGSLGFQAGFEAFRGSRISSVVSGKKSWRAESPGINALAGRVSKNLSDVLAARAVKGGFYPVVADEELVDVLIHEAFGHAAEADGVVDGESCLDGFAGRSVVKNKSASDELTIVDDASMSALWGSFFFDDEGVRAKRTVIVKDGVLSSFLHSRETAAVMGVASTGNARGESIGSFPVVRMSNTNLVPGTSSDDELFEGIKNGFFLRGSSGGQVDIVKGTFQFNSSYGYAVRNGEIAYPVRGVSLSGSTLEMLGSIEQIGKIPSVGMAGFCGKHGQSVPVVGFNPKIRLSRALVGGE